MIDFDIKRLTENIKTLRDKNDLTQPEVAKKANIPLRTFQDILYGKRIPGADNLVSIANAFGVVEGNWCPR